MAALDPVLSSHHLRRAVLGRQLLLERVHLPLPEVLDRVAGLQSQYAPTMYVGLWSRLDGFARADLTGALERREVVQGTLMRSTIHLVSAADYWPLALAVRAARRRWWRRVNPAGPDEAGMAAAVDRVRVALAAEGRLPRKELDRAAGAAGALGVGLWLDLVRVPPSGTWERRRADLYAAADEWLGPPPDMAPADALDHLVRRYLTGFGPATANDIASWAGMSVGDVAPSVAGLGLDRFRTESGQALVDLPGSPLPDPATSAPVRFLSTWEAILLAHARRTGVLREEDRPPGLPHQDPPVGQHLSGRRRGGGYVASRGKEGRGRALPAPAAATGERRPGRG